MSNKMKMNKIVVGTVSAAALALAASSASAAVDVGVTTAIGTLSTDLATIGGLIIGLAVVAMGIRWTKATFF